LFNPKTSLKKPSHILTIIILAVIIVRSAWLNVVTSTHANLTAAVASHGDIDSVEDQACYSIDNSSELVALQFLVAPKRVYPLSEDCKTYFP
jgi:hypothetical protein